MLFLVLKVTGVPPTEAQSVKSRGDDYRAYHDEEWGVPLHDDRKLFEFLVLDAFQLTNGTYPALAGQADDAHIGPTVVTTLTDILKGVMARARRGENVVVAFFLAARIGKRCSR